MVRLRAMRCSGTGSSDMAPKTSICLRFVNWNTGIVSPILEHFADGILGPKSGAPAVLAVAKGPLHECRRVLTA